MANVFISHRGADLALAERLASELKGGGGHEIWLDGWKIDIGDSIVGKINAGLAGNTAVILCLSSSGLSSWMNAEWMSTLARQLQGQDVKLLPARLSGGDLPPILADLKYADLVVDWVGGVAALMKALQRLK